MTLMFSINITALCVCTYSVWTTTQRHIHPLRNQQMLFPTSNIVLGQSAASKHTCPALLWPSGQSLQCLLAQIGVIEVQHVQHFIKI